MPPPHRINARDLSIRLQAMGPTSASELAAAFRVDPSTITRNLAQIGDSLVSLGATRRTRYAIRRGVCGAHTWPIHRIGWRGDAHAWATLESYHGAWRIAWENGAPEWASAFSDREGVWNGFPFFVSDLRPQGYLGCGIARRITDTHTLPPDPRDWQDDDTLIYLSIAGHDLPGDLILGDSCLRRALAQGITPLPASTLSADAATTRYAEMALTSASDPPIGSSAGGEQPKFLAHVADGEGGGRPVIVKFSPPVDQTAGRRWADLLSMEFHALGVLAGAGLSIPGHRLIESGNRFFLEASRFDRHPNGGRSGIVSLEALHHAAVGGISRDWSALSGNLLAAGLIASETLDRIRRLQAFGEMIGNTDMHPGNLSFRLTDSLPFSLSPAYDMLPMLWAPGSGGEIAARDFQPLPPVPANAPYWREMLPLARAFWEIAAADPRISAEMTAAARQASRALEKIAARL